MLPLIIVLSSVALTCIVLAVILVVKVGRAYSS